MAHSYPEQKCFLCCMVMAVIGVLEDFEYTLVRIIDEECHLKFCERFLGLSSMKHVFVSTRPPSSSPVMIHTRQKILTSYIALLHMCDIAGSGFICYLCTVYVCLIVKGCNS